MPDTAFHQCQISHQGLEFQVPYFIRPGVAGPLVCLHGMGSSKEDFLLAARHQGLSDYTLVAFDFPGCGATPYPARICRIDDLVEITDRFVSALKISGFIMMGHSMGGLTGLLYAMRYGSKLKGFVDIEGNLAPEDCFLTRDIARLSFADFLATEHLQNLKVRLAGAPYKGTRIWAEDLGKRGSARAIYDYAVSIANWSDNDDLLTEFMSLPIPKLFVYGSANSHLSYLPRLKVSETCVVEVPDSGHWPHQDNPDFFYSAVADFLQREVQPMAPAQLPYSHPNSRN